MKITVETLTRRPDSLLFANRGVRGRCHAECSTNYWNEGAKNNTWGMGVLINNKKLKGGAYWKVGAKSNHYGTRYIEGQI